MAKINQGKLLKLFQVVFFVELFGAFTALLIFQFPWFLQVSTFIYLFCGMCYTLILLIRKENEKDPPLTFWEFLFAMEHVRMFVFLTSIMKTSFNYIGLILLVLANVGYAGYWLMENFTLEITAKHEKLNASGSGAEELKAEEVKIEEVEDEDDQKQFDVAENQESESWELEMETSEDDIIIEEIFYGKEMRENFFQKVATRDAEYELLRLKAEYEEDRRNWMEEKRNLLEENAAEAHFQDFLKATSSLKLKALFSEEEGDVIKNYESIIKKMEEEKEAMEQEFQQCRREWDVERSYMEEEHKYEMGVAEEERIAFEEENALLVARLNSETQSTEHSIRLMRLFEERCRVLEADKANLTAKLDVAKASCEVYRAFMHNIN